MKKLTEQLELADDRPEITPLIDVIFMLLLFFIVTTTFAEDTFFPITLPTGHNTTVRTPTDAVTVEISRDGELALERKFVPSERRLYERLQTLQQNKQFTSVIIKADEHADAKHIVTVLDILRGLEITEFAIVAESEQ